MGTAKPHRLRQLAVATMLAGTLAACGGGGSDDVAAPAPGPAPVATPAAISLFAGTSSGFGSIDGTGRGAYFNRPEAMDRLPDGSLWVADQGNALIRRVTPAGVVTRVAGQVPLPAEQPMRVDGPASVNRIAVLSDIAAAPEGGAYFIDVVPARFSEPASHRLRHVTPGGVMTTFTTPADVISLATSPQGGLVAASTTAIYASTASGFVLIAGSEGESATRDGEALQARFVQIGDVALAPDGTVYVSEPRSHTVRRLRNGRVDTLAGAAGLPGTADGNGPTARFNNPVDLSLDGEGRLWVADLGNGLVRRTTPDGQVSTPFGTDSTFSGATSEQRGVGIAAGAEGDLYFTNGAGVSRLDATGSLHVLGGQDFVSGQLGHVAGLGVDRSGTVTVAQSLGGDGPVFPAYRLTRWSARGERQPSISDVPATLRNVQNFAVDANGNTITTVLEVKHGSINVFMGAGGSIVRVAPDGTSTTLVSWAPDSPGAMAPGYVALGRDGAIYFIDLMVRTDPATGLGSYSIVRWTPTGGAQPLAPIPGFLLFSAPSRSLAADAEGRVYVIGQRGVQRVEEGRLVTVAGDLQEAGNADGQGTAARFNSPRAATIDAAGNLYIADGELIRRMTPGGLVTTVAGTRGSVGLHLGDLPGSLATVTHLALAPDGSLLAVSGTALVRIRLP